MSIKICPKCSPLAPFTGVPLKREKIDSKLYDKEGNLLEVTMYCRACKKHFVDKVPMIKCPLCSKDLIIAKRYIWKCPSCDTTY